MDISSKLKILDRIYTIYDRFAAELDLACIKYCAHCCTSGVTLTTLEGYKIIDSLISATKTDVIYNLKAAPEMVRFRPQITTNCLANLCAEDIEPPAEIGGQELSACPILLDRQCPIYELRPYGCRCLVSRHNCGDKGYAEIDDFVLSLFPACGVDFVLALLGMERDVSPNSEVSFVSIPDLIRLTSAL